MLSSCFSCIAIHRGSILGLPPCNDAGIVADPALSLLAMAWLSQQASSDLQQALRQTLNDQARDTRALEEAVLTVRSRLRADGAIGTVNQQRDTMLHALRPLWAWLMSEPDASALELPELSELTWNLLVAGLSRTQGADACPLITGDLDLWNGLIQELLLERGAGSSTVAMRPATTSLPNVGPLHLVAGGLLCLALDGWLPSGRVRFYMMMLGASLLVVATMWWMRQGEANPTTPERRTTQPERNRPSWSGVQLTGDDIPTSGGANPGAVAEPLPGGGGIIPPIPTASQAGGMKVGCLVRIADDHETLALRGQQGKLLAVREDGYEVLLDSGIVASRISSASLSLSSVTQSSEQVVNPMTVAPQSAPALVTEASQQFYAPFAGTGLPNKTQSQAARLKDALVKAHGLSATMASWPALFWQAVKNEKDLYGLDETVKRTLEAHGYLGDASNGPPRVDEMKLALSQLETAGGPPHGAGDSILRGDGPPGLASDPEQMAWHLRLPSDLQRAAPELYRNIRSEGAASVRQWVNEQHPTTEQKQGAQYQDLFTAATIIDYEVASCKSEDTLMHRLATSDTLEIQLRKLGAFIYLRRTKDKTGANRMLGIRAPGTNTDIAPKWMVDDANTFSKVEFQRQERGHKAQRYEGGGSGSTTNSASTGGGASKFRGRGNGRKGGGRGGGGSKGPKTQG